MKQFKVLAEIDGKTEEFIIFADRWAYEKSTRIFTFENNYSIVALFRNNVKAVIEITDELSKDTLKKCIDEKKESR